MSVLVLGGTAEARELSYRIPVLSSLAGRTSTPRLPRGDVRIGPFGGDGELAGWIRQHRARALVDATHPFADRITARAARVATELHLPFVVLRRPGWTSEPGDRWHDVGSIAEAAARVAGVGTRVFLTTGRTELAPFATVAGVWFLIRTVDPPKVSLPPHRELLQARGPFEVQGERELMRSHRIDLLVSKDSGGRSTSAKLVAARELGIPVLMIRRPAVPVGVRTCASVDEVLRWLADIGD